MILAMVFRYAGRYESTLGLEAKEPTGLYQYSTAYDSALVLALTSSTVCTGCKAYQEFW